MQGALKHADDPLSAPPDPDLERDPQTPKPSSFDGPLPPNLVKFRNIVGIATPVNIKGDDRSRPAQNVGIYSRVVAEEKKTSWQYQAMAAIIQICFLGQIVVAATLTALGAADASHVAITVLGSVNTVIAGVQTYFKGQGLSNLLRQYKYGLRKLREHIEDHERDFSAADCKLEVDHKIADIVAMYKAVRQTAEDNTPDTYLPMQGAGKSLLGKSDNRTGMDSVGLGNAESSTNRQGEDRAEAATLKPAPSLGIADQVNGSRPSESEEVGQDYPVSEAPADSGAAKGEHMVTSMSPNEEGETEEAPLLSPNGKTRSLKD